MIDLYDFQREDVDYLEAQTSCLIANEMVLMTRPRRDPLDVFASYVKQDESGCLIWSGAVGGAGDYGIFTLYISPGVTHTFPAHRWIWEYHNGTIPDGMILHHTCETKACVNLDHLELLTTQEHEVEHRKELCKNGHDQSIHRYYKADGSAWGCKECRREAVRAWNRRKRAGR